MKILESNILIWTHTAYILPLVTLILPYHYRFGWKTGTNMIPTFYCPHCKHGWNQISLCVETPLFVLWQHTRQFIDKALKGIFEPSIKTLIELFFRVIKGHKEPKAVCYVHNNCIQRSHSFREHWSKGPPFTHFQHF